MGITTYKEDSDDVVLNVSKDFSKTCPFKGAYHVCMELCVEVIINIQ